MKALSRALRLVAAVLAMPALLVGAGLLVPAVLVAWIAKRLAPSSPTLPEILATLTQAGRTDDDTRQTSGTDAAPPESPHRAAGPGEPGDVSALALVDSVRRLVEAQTEGPVHMPSGSWTAPNDLRRES